MAVGLNLPIGENFNWRKSVWLNHVNINMATHEVNSCVRGFHVYSDIWTPFVGETLVCEQESGNPNDPYAVAIKKGSEVVGHVPRKSSAACSLFLLLGGQFAVKSPTINDATHQICHRVGWRYLVNLFSKEIRSAWPKYGN